MHQFALDRLLDPMPKSFRDACIKLGIRAKPLNGSALLEPEAEDGRRFVSWEQPGSPVGWNLRREGDQGVGQQPLQSD